MNTFTYYSILLKTKHKKKVHCNQGSSELFAIIIILKYLFIYLLREKGREKW